MNEKKIFEKTDKKEDFWDKYKKLLSEFSLDKSNFQDFSLDKRSSEEKSQKANNKRRNNIYEGLGDHNNGVQLGIKESSFTYIWKNNVNSYL